MERGNKIVQWACYDRTRCLVLRVVVYSSVDCSFALHQTEERRRQVKYCIRHTTGATRLYGAMRPNSGFSSSFWPQGVTAAQEWGPIQGSVTSFSHRVSLQPRSEYAWRDTSPPFLGPLRRIWALIYIFLPRMTCQNKHRNFRVECTVYMTRR